jgi:hypothetical protein
VRVQTPPAHRAPHEARQQIATLASITGGPSGPHLLRGDELRLADQSGMRGRRGTTHSGVGVDRRDVLQE